MTSRELRRVIADDFTGACDAGGGLALPGRPAWVVTLSDRPPPDQDAVVVVDIDARDGDEPTATARAQEAASWFERAAERDPLMLKVDSTLRGPIAAMLDGVMAGTGRTRAFVALAFPERGRTVLQGRLRWTDGPNEGILIADAIRASSPPRLVGRSELHVSGRSPETSHDRTGDPVTIVDGATLEDMDLAARWWCRAGADAILVGSAGIARAVRRSRDQPDVRLPRAIRSRLVRGGGLVVVAGSAAVPTHRQLARLTALDWTRPERARASHRTERLVCFATDPAEAKTLDAGQEATLVANAAATWARSHEPPAAAVVIGGQTGRALMDLISVEAVRIDGELEPGVPIGQLKGGPWDGVPLVTKAGAFGDDELLTRIVERLVAAPRSRVRKMRVSHGR